MLLINFNRLFEYIFTRSGNMNRIAKHLATDQPQVHTFGANYLSNGATNSNGHTGHECRFTSKKFAHKFRPWFA